MKRIVLLLSLAIFCAAAVCWGIPHYRLAQEKARRHAGYEQMLADSNPLVLDAATQAILNGADRVETFRLESGDEDFTPEEEAALHGAHPLFLEDHPVMDVGVPQGKSLASALHAALAQVYSGPDGAQCFEPGVGYRVWKGKAFVDICVCFTCQGIEITTHDAKHKIVSQSLTLLGKSRPALLMLSQQAFPNDKRLASLKPEAE